MTTPILSKAEQAALNHFLSDLIAVCEEVAKEPYPDSDPASLLKTLRTRAETVLRGDKPIEFESSTERKLK